MKKVITYNDIDFEVSGEYFQGIKATWETPGEQELIDNFDVLIDGVSMYEMLNQKSINDLYELALEECR